MDYLEDYAYNFTYTYDCNEGMRFNNGRTSINIVCGQGRRWNNSDNVTCDCKLSAMEIFIVVVMNINAHVYEMHLSYI